MIKTIFIFTIVCIGACSTPGNIDITLPKGFQGNVIIVFKQEDGMEEEYTEQGDRVYQIPPSGILYTQFESFKGAATLSVYFIDEDDRRTKIPLVLSYAELDKASSEIVAFDPSIGAIVRKYDGDQLIAEYPPYLSLIVSEMSRVEEFSDSRTDLIFKVTQNK